MQLRTTSYFIHSAIHVYDIHRLCHFHSHMCMHAFNSKIHSCAIWYIVYVLINTEGIPNLILLAQTFYDTEFQYNNLKISYRITFFIYKNLLIHVILGFKPNVACIVRSEAHGGYSDTSVHETLCAMTNRRGPSMPSITECRVHYA